MNEQAEHRGTDAQGAADHKGVEPKTRPIYDKSASEATREMRVTSRRRREAEEKLQQHLRDAKDHVPHHHSEVSPGSVKAGVDPGTGEEHGTGRVRPDLAPER
jgi:hypothetical protein